LTWLFFGLLLSGYAVAVKHGRAFGINPWKSLNFLSLIKESAPIRQTETNRFPRRTDMEQKYILKKKDTQFIIQELAETEPGKFALLFEEKLDLNRMALSVNEGTRAIIDLFRSHNFYPPAIFSDLLANRISSMFGSDPKDSLTVEFNDNDALRRRGQLMDHVVDEKELAEIDKLLENEDEISDDFDD